jgi:hypothetical protein
MKRAGMVPVLLVLGAACGDCASKGGKAVTVVYDPGYVRGCSFLGRITQTTTEDAPLGEGLLRQRTADMGGDTLLIRGGGAGEAWDCAGKVSAYAPPAAPTKSRPVTGAYPTPPATPRY